MGDPRESELVAALAAAVVEADATDPRSLAAVREALEAARGRAALPAAVATAADALLSRLATVDGAGGALLELGRLLDGEGKGSPKRSGKIDRDTETVDLIGDFIEEATEALARADELLLGIEKSGPDPGKVHALFRVFHTIKGVAGFLELPEIVSVAHATEGLLNLAREKQIDLDGEPFDVVFDATAALRRQLDDLHRAVEERVALAVDPEVAALVARIDRAAGLGIDAARAGAVVPALGHAPGAAVVKKEYVLRKPRAAPSVPRPPPPSVPAPVPEAAVRRDDPVRGSGRMERDVIAQIRETVKVDLERVDSMVEMIGELIIVESMIIYSPEIASLGSLRLRNYLNQLNKISRDLQNVAMRMRMVPVRSAFQKMARLARDLSRKTGKEVVLEMDGEETEMDRSMVERIEEPLVHMVRNAIDHGVEPASERKAAGKAGRATVRLAAYHEGGSIVVEISDDGRGLQREAILARARENRLLDPDAALDDQEIFNLLFLPGFSTAAEVTEISGRGVGMDVVKRNVEGMRGRVTVASTPGQGTTFRMVLPLTLAIIDGMLIACGPEKYIVPSLAIVESLRPTRDMLAAMAGKGEVINVRGEILPLLRLHRLLDMPGEERDPTESHVVVVEGLGRKVGLVVDDVVAQQQVVIKPLGAGLGDTEYLSGAAILSDGRVGLILNVDRLASLVTRTRDRGAKPREVVGA